MFVSLMGNEGSDMEEGKDVKLGVVETQFADIIWKNEPLASGELEKICEKK